MKYLNLKSLLRWQFGLVYHNNCDLRKMQGCISAKGDSYIV